MKLSDVHRVESLMTYIFKKIYIFNYLAMLGLSYGTWIFDTCCSMWDLQLQHANSLLCHEESSSLTRDQTQAPCIGNTQSYPLDHQGSPCAACSIPLIYMSVFVPVPHCFDYCRFIVLSEVWEGCASSCVLFPQVCFGNSGSFVVSYKFQDYLFQFCEKQVI